MEHNHLVTANTDEVFRTFIGEKVKGILHDFAFENQQTILVFECGWGLAFNSNGSHWTENPEKIERLKRNTKEQIDNLLKESRDIPTLAGE